MYRGFVASGAALPSFGVYFLSYNFTKDKLQAINDRHASNDEHRTCTPSPCPLVAILLTLSSILPPHAAMWVAASAACVADVSTCSLPTFTEFLSNNFLKLDKY
jgi:hypothetical protein